jgi:hypothetical protein
MPTNIGCKTRGSRTETVNTVIGFDFDEGRRSCIAHARAAEHLSRSRYFRAQPNGFNLSNFHRSPEVLVILVAVTVLVFRADDVPCGFVEIEAELALPLGQ